MKNTKMYRIVKREIYFLFLAILFSQITFTLPLGQAETQGVIRGKIKNGTIGGTNPTNIEVILYILGEREDEIAKTRTNKDGSFIFSKLNIEKDKSYYVKTNYRGVEYFSPTISFDKGKEHFINLTVYETTDKDDNIYAKVHHIFMNLENDNLFVKEIIILENRGDRVYVGLREIEPQRREVIRISLPKNSKDLELERNLMECCIIKTIDGFVDTMDIKPGLKEISFTYQIDYGSSVYNLNKTIYTKTESIDFFVPDKDVEVKSEILHLRGTVENRNEQFKHFAGNYLRPGSELILQFKGLPRGRVIFKYLILILVFSAFAGGLAYPFIKKRKHMVEITQQGLYSLKEEKDLIFKEIVYLDQRFESREIDHEEYQSKRKNLIEKAVMITRQMRKENEV